MTLPPQRSIVRAACLLAVLSLCGVAQGFALTKHVSLGKMGPQEQLSRQWRGRAPATAKVIKMDLGQVALGGYGLFSLFYLGQLARPNRRKLDSDPYTVLAGIKLFHTPDGVAKPVTDAWGADDRAVVVLFRSFG
jgi:hypothetical protein